MDSPVDFTIEHVDRLSKALEKLKEGGFDLILSDLTVPDSSGIVTFERLKEAGRELPIIILSGSHDEALAFQTVE